ncbi:kinesin motor domain protein, partial [Ostertagia ostertagi]
MLKAPNGVVTLDFDPVAAGEPEGIIPRAVKFLFQSRDKLADLDWQFEFKASFIEVYNEEIYDLLGERKKLDIENILAVTDLTRSTAATKCNEQSSRSHAVFELAIQGHNTTSGSSRHACLHLVDLAGSERVKESGSEGRLERLKSVSLFQNQQIPYRNSKLTMILRDSLEAGNSKTMVIVTLNPAVTQIPEAKCSLEFAQQAVRRLLKGDPVSMEWCRSKEEKMQLLDAAIDIVDGSVILAVVLFLKSTLMNSLFRDLLLRRSQAADEHVAYLKATRECDELATTLFALGRNADAAMVEFSAAIRHQVPEQKVQAFKKCVRSGFSDPMLVADAAIIADYQSKNAIFTAFPKNASFVGKPVIATYYYCCLYHYDDPL